MDPYCRELVEKRIVEMKGRDGKIAELEQEIAELLAKNNILLNEKQKIIEYQQVGGRVGL